MEQIVFDYKNPRAQAARASRRFGKGIQLFLLASSVGSAIVGVSALIFESVFGWILIGMASWPLMIYFYARDYLREIPLGKTEFLNDILDSEILAKLPTSPTPKDIASAVLRTNGGGFFATRFGIGQHFLYELASENSEDAIKVWQAALAIRHEIGRRELSAAVMVAALIETHPPMQDVLNHLHLDSADIRKGIDWYYHIQDLILADKKPKRTGGIARDLAFGYTPLLKRFGINISEHISAGGLLAVDTQSHVAALDQMVQIFSAKGRQNVALIGETGVGKTTIVHGFAEKLLNAKSGFDQSIKFRQVIMMDPSALISAAPGRGQIEGLVNELLVEAYKAKNVILCFDDAHLFFEDGVGSVDISNILVPVLEGGGLRMILAMDEQKYLQIAQRKPNLANALNRVMVPPATEEETIQVLQDQLIMTEYRSKVVYMYQSLREAYRLSERYVYELAQPGRAFKLLESAANYSQDGVVTAQSVQNTIEQTLNIKVGVASGEEEREKLLNLEDQIHERMINQTHAVKVVSDALRRARAGVRNENRPIGTFLFLGPTGVGKTELAKALAEVYFGGEGNIARIDLNEYVKIDDVARLIADGADDPNSLTAQVMKQPFSVVLLDEIEKAHPNVLTTLLQVLDEGILRDIKNREVSFRDTIIIATSNAGADKIRAYIEQGQHIEQFEAQITNDLIESQQFRPEFLNRFDEIVVFRPLTKEELLKVIDLILASVNKNMALQKITIDVEEDAKRLLVDKGYDPRLGARPMRRIVQRTVENIVAKTMLSGQIAPGSTIRISRGDIENSL